MRHPRRRRARTAILRRGALALLLPALLCLTGCRLLEDLLDLLADAAAAGAFRPGSQVGGGAGATGIPNLLGGAGAGGPSPGSSLPPPTGGAVPAAKLQETYGIRITGSGATPENLEKVAFGLARYNREHLQGIEHIDIPSVPSHNLNGLWEMSGGIAKITYWAHTNRRDQVFKTTVVHEIGHHASLSSRAEVLGDPLSMALGEGDDAFPTDYSRTSEAEKLAENLAFILCGNEAESAPYPEWKPSARAMEIVRTEFRR